VGIIRPLRHVSATVRAILWSRGLNYPYAIPQNDLPIRGPQYGCCGATTVKRPKISFFTVCHPLHHVYQPHVGSSVLAEAHIPCNHGLCPVGLPYFRCVHNNSSVHWFFITNQYIQSCDLFSFQSTLVLGSYLVHIEYFHYVMFTIEAFRAAHPQCASALPIRNFIGRVYFFGKLPYEFDRFY